MRNRFLEAVLERRSRERLENVKWNERPPPGEPVNIVKTPRSVQCAQCGKQFATWIASQKFCNQECTKLAHRRPHKPRKPPLTPLQKRQRRILKRLKKLQEERQHVEPVSPAPGDS